MAEGEITPAVNSTPETNSTPTNSPPEANSEGVKRDPLKTPLHEASEIEALIRGGHSSHIVVGLLTIIGLAIIATGFGLYKFDTLFFAEGKGDQTFAQWLKLQVDKDQADFRRSLKNKNGSTAKLTWPVPFYHKQRRDIYLVGGLVAALALIFSLIERAKMRRQDLLVYRAMAREVEKLRLRVRLLEGKKNKSGGEAETSAPASTPPTAPESSGLV